MLISSATTNAAELTAATICYTKDYTAVAIAQRNKEEEDFKHEVVRFEEVGSKVESSHWTIGIILGLLVFVIMLAVHAKYHFKRYNNNLKILLPKAEKTVRYAIAKFEREQNSKMQSKK